jgi:hypothetical protein
VASGGEAVSASRRRNREGSLYELPSGRWRAEITYVDQRVAARPASSDLHPPRPPPGASCARFSDWLGREPRRVTQRSQ